MMASLRAGKEQRARIKQQKPGFMDRMLGPGEAPTLTTEQRESKIESMPGLAPDERPPLATSTEFEELNRKKKEQQFESIELGEDEERTRLRANSSLAKLGGEMKNATRDIITFAVMLPIISKKWAESLAASQEHLKNYSGRIAAAFGDLERQAILLNLQQARGTEASFQMMTDELMELRENTQPIQQLSNNIKNLLSTGLLTLANVIVQPLKIITEYLSKFLDIAIDDKKKSSTEYRALLRQFQQGAVIDPTDPNMGFRPDLHQPAPGNQQFP